MVEVPPSRAQSAASKGDDGEGPALRKRGRFEAKPEPSEVEITPNIAGIRTPVPHRCSEFLRRHPAAVVYDRYIWLARDGETDIYCVGACCD